LYVLSGYRSTVCLSYQVGQNLPGTDVSLFIRFWTAYKNFIPAYSLSRSFRIERACNGNVAQGRVNPCTPVIIDICSCSDAIFIVSCRNGFLPREVFFQKCVLNQFVACCG